MPKTSNTPFEGCLYYHGETECPFDMRSIQYTFWRMELMWIKIIRDNEIESDNKLAELLVDFPDAIESIQSIPTTLKATIYSQYCRFGGSKESFEDYLVEYLSKAPLH